MLSCSYCSCCRTESSKKKPPIYKVMLHNDNYNRREYVVKILLKTVEGLTVDDAVNVMQVCACGRKAAATGEAVLREAVPAVCQVHSTHHAAAVAALRAHLAHMMLTLHPLLSLLSCLCTGST
jgi:ATP-dependent Clp protease adapter protein ClpS